MVEIGPGAGALTQLLAASVHRVIAIEIDKELVIGLRRTLPPNVEVVESDAREIEWPCSRFHLIGNLPYNIATQLLKRFIDARDRIVDVTVMIQKEVADRLIAKPGTADYGPLSVLMQYYSNITYGFTVPPGAFKPPPKVDSAVIRVDWKQGVAEAHEFTAFVQRAFSSRRKKLVNNLLQMFPSLGRENILRCIGHAGIKLDARPQELSVAEFLRVYNQLSPWKAGTVKPVQE